MVGKKVVDRIMMVDYNKKILKLRKMEKRKKKKDG